jgi:hypothetical protein
MHQHGLGHAQARPADFPQGRPVDGDVVSFTLIVVGMGGFPRNQKDLGEQIPVAWSDCLSLMHRTDILSCPRRRSGSFG